VIDPVNKAAASSSGQFRFFSIIPTVSMATRGVLFIVSAPSGAGKTTLVRELLKRDPQIGLSISHTTRAPRPGEVDGVAYHFVGSAQFDAMRAADDFLEWAQVHGNFYGTSRRWLEERLSAGHDVLLEIDWQGAQQVRRLFPDAVGIFILPPSLEALATRLTGRGQDAADVIERRLAAARDEIRHLDEFDFVIINNILGQAQDDLVTVTRAARLLRTSQMARSPEFFKSLGIN
jgi:guanylate kinase